jgi:hypothetical protein
MSLRPRAAIALIGVICTAIGVSACGETSSTGSYKGESKKVAQTISNLQNDATARNAGKVCGRDLAASVVKRLESDGKTCKKVLEHQLDEVDTYSLTVDSISLSGNDAKAKVKSTWSGKEEVHEVAFVKEGDSWKVAGLI